MKQDEIIKESEVEPGGAPLPGEEGPGRIEELAAENEQLRDRLLRLAAEFDNYRKRADREMANFSINANANLVARLLSSLDDLDRILSATETGIDSEALLSGVKLFQKNLVKALQDEGLQPMVAVGEPFDPEKHDALLHVEEQDREPNTVIDEHRKGYYFKDRVIRHAQVIVSK